MAKPIFDPGSKVLTREYDKIRNLGMYNRTSVTLRDYIWANLTKPQGYGPYDEFDIFDNVKSTLENKKLTIKDYPKNE